MLQLDSDVQFLLEHEAEMSTSEYIESVLRIHYRLTVIHAFGDGNGRTARAFTNMLFVRKGLPPVLFRSTTKNPYKDSLAIVDATGDYSSLYEVYFKAMINSHTELSCC